MAALLVFQFILFQFGGGSSSSLLTFAPFILIFAVFYFLMILPNQKKQKKWQEMLANIKSGDKITTTGGLRGTVIAIKDDAFQLRIPPDNIRLEVVKTAIATVTTGEEMMTK